MRKDGGELAVHTAKPRDKGQAGRLGRGVGRQGGNPSARQGHSTSQVKSAHRFAAAPAIRRMPAARPQEAASYGPARLPSL